MEDNLRPDNCGVLFEHYEKQKTVLALTTSNNWREGSTGRLIQTMVTDGYFVWVVIGKERNLLLPHNKTEQQAIDKIIAVWKEKKHDST